MYNWDSKIILIAEDEEINYLFLAEALHKTNATVLWAKNGQEAIDICNNKKIDIILMDMKMPIKSGYEATSEIKQKYKIPIIAQTAYATGSHKQQLIDVGCDDLIAKPIRFKNLLAILSKHISAAS